MAKLAQKEHALALRREGKSYNEIKSEVGVSKGTLSLWLREMPLTEERIRELRGSNPGRIEKYRETCRIRREKQLKAAYEVAKDKIGALSQREEFLIGLALYWGEGTKSHNTETSLANTDPAMATFFVRWLLLLGIPKQQIRVRLHVYVDMDEKAALSFWSKQLGIPITQFRKSYVKSSKLSGLSYRSGHGHGTCNIRYANRVVNDLVLEGLNYIREYLSSKPE